LDRLEEEDVATEEMVNATAEPNVTEQVTVDIETGENRENAPGQLDEGKDKADKLDTTRVLKAAVERVQIQHNNLTIGCLNNRVVCTARCK
jgi:hypothetical protein